MLTNPEDIGIVENFAKCVHEARGDYLVLASDDNILDPAFLEKCVRLVRMEPGIPIVLAAYDVLVIDEFSKDERRIVPAIPSKKLSTGIWDGTEILSEYLNGRISAQLLSSIIRIDILRRNGGYSIHPCSADEATWIPFLLEGRAGLVNEGKPMVGSACCCRSCCLHRANRQCDRHLGPIHRRQHCGRRLHR